MSEADAQRVRDILQGCGALDGLSHAQHLLQQADALLCGLDAWLLGSPEGVPTLSALGKSAPAAAPDRESYRAALKGMCAG